MTIEHFSVYRDNLKISGIAYLSNNGGETMAPAIIMSHGFMGNLDMFKYFAETFCNIGYNVYTFNFCGGSLLDDEELKSDGKSEDLCLESEIKDLTAIYSYVSLQKCVKNDEIYLLGESQGALVSGLTAVRLQEKIKKLIMIFPAVCIPDHARRGVLGGANYDPANVPDTFTAGNGVPLGKAFHNEVKEMDVYSELAKYRGETLLIQGDSDSVVVPEYQYLVKDLFDNTDLKCLDNIRNNSDVKNNVDLSVNGSRKHRLKFQMVRGMDHYTGGEHKENLAEAIRFFIEGKEEVLTFRIIITKVESLDNNDKLNNIETKDNDGMNKELPIHEQDIYFTGYCESDLFTGTIISGVDHQAYRGDECIKMSADYKFVGLDPNEEYCEMCVSNNAVDGVWRPVIKTDSKALSWLNEADLFGIVEAGPKGPTIRIYK